MPSGLPQCEQRVLILAPYGRDARVTCEVLHDAGFESLACDGMERLSAELKPGAGVLVIAAEALHPGSMPALVNALKCQPAWSDIPIIVATDENQARAARDWVLHELDLAGHVTLLERPIRIQTLVSVVRSALTTRQRQYELRNLVEELRATVEHLDAEHLVRDSFINLLAHDLRGPLGVIKMNAELLGYCPGQVELVAGRIGKSIDRADKMIRNLLDAHRLRAGQLLPLEPELCDLVEIVQEVAAGLDDKDRERVAVEAGDATRLLGRWDPDLLWRALWNLVTNAIKYGASDTPITISVEREGAVARARVHNLGPTIPEDEQNLVFGAFARTISAKAGNQRGWGLGLTLVQGVAEAHGGELHVCSEPAFGTCFTLQLPLTTDTER